MLVGHPDLAAILRARALARARRARRTQNVREHLSLCLEHDLVRVCGRPVLVDVGVFVDHFYGVQNMDGTFKANIYLLQRYDDQRNRFAGGIGKGKVFAQERISLCEKRKHIGAVCWAPKIEISNIAERRRVGGSVIAFSNGTTEKIERIEATFETSFDFASYPFDKQTLEIKVEPEHMYMSHMLLREWTEVTGLNMGKYMESIQNGMSREQAFDEIQSSWQRLEPDLQWAVTGFGSQIESVTPRYAQLHAHGEDQTKMRYVFTLKVTRSSHAYVWNFIVPTNFLAALSWAGFWISPAVSSVDTHQC